MIGAARFSSLREGDKEPGILVIAAHPDDEVLGCGGTIAKLSRECEVFIAILGEGITSRYQKREQANETQLEKLREKSREVRKLLGAKDVFFFGLPDNRFDELPLLEVVKRVESVIEKVKPSIIYTHHYGDLNIDHQITFRAVLTATRPIKGCTVKEIYAFEIPSSTEWGFQKLGGPFSPNVFVDVSDTIHLKLQAMRLYESEAREFPHPRSPEAIRAIAARWGSVCGLDYAEAFELIRSIRS